MTTIDDMVEWAMRDEVTVRLLREATETDNAGWVCCPGQIDGRRCTLKLVMCMRCRTAGCFAFAQRCAECPNTVLDPSRTCVHCGEPAGMNRVIKGTAYALGRAWAALRVTTT